MRVGERAFLVELRDLASVRQLYDDLRVRAFPGIVDLVPAARTLLVVVDAENTEATELTGWIRAWKPSVDERHVGQHRHAEIDVPVVYDGADLAEAALRCGMSTGELIERHRDGHYEVAFCGFAPGFAYLSGLDRRLHLARRADPRPAVPAGAVAIAGEFTGVYPRGTPGGWYLLGHSDIRLWDSYRATPSLLQPGMSVRFVETT